MRVLALALVVLCAPLRAEYHVAADGKEQNAGTKEAPWDLASTLSGAHKIEPGTTVWIHGGEYRGKFETKLAGSEAAPIRLRAVRGERAAIVDSGLTVAQGSDYLWIEGLEIYGTAPVEKRVTDQTGSWPKDLPGTNGLTIHGGRGCKYINLVIHDNLLGGVGWWVGSTDSEMHGCVIYNNGWKAPDRTHGHCIYVQNKDGLKTISGCIFAVPAWGGSYTLHAYGSKNAYVDNFVIEDNIAYERGTFLVGGGRPSNHIKVARNYLHGLAMQIGYGAQNEDCEIRDNIVPSKLNIQKYNTIVDEGNVRELPAARSALILNKYDPKRAHLAVYNGAKAERVAVDVSAFLKPGDSFRLLDPKDLFGKPVLEGKVDIASLEVPLSGDFAAFVMVKP